MLVPEQKPDLASIALELVEMGNLDRASRKEAVKFDPELDKKNMLRVQEIIEKYGFPTISKFGKDAAEATFLIVQHAPGAEGEVFREEILSILNEINHNGQELEIEKHWIAYLQDRILVERGSEQVYGTQAYVRDDGQVYLRPIQDLENVDLRRQLMGIEPLADYCGRNGYIYERD